MTKLLTVFDSYNSITCIRSFYMDNAYEPRLHTHTHTHTHTNSHRQKESHLPFPSEHPYTSHISRFSVFPDTKTNLPCIQGAAEPNTPQSASPDLRPNTVNVCTQTPLTHAHQHTAASLSTMAPKPATPYYVLQKASERGHRVESRSLTLPAPMEIRYGSQGCSLLWDIPRSHRHQVRWRNQL